jgi:hypothetical protein
VSPADRAVAVLRWVARLPATALVLLVRGYQLLVSPMFGPVCRFHPSCSSYAVGALRTHGAVRGTGLTLWRLARCNPWNAGGVDDVPPRRGRTTATRTSTGHTRGRCTQGHPVVRAVHVAACATTHHDGAPDHPVRAA